MTIDFNIEQIDKAANQLLESVNSKIILFYGEMGVGKTTLISALVRQLGGDSEVSSPTFSIVNEYFFFIPIISISYTYNKYKNSIETVYSGLKIAISTNKDIIELASIENYNKYKFGFISTPSRNYNNNSAIEVIINENNKTILMIWYQGNDLLNYYYRNSSYSVGKSILTNKSDI